MLRGGIDALRTGLTAARSIRPSVNSGSGQFSACARTPRSDTPTMARLNSSVSPILPNEGLFGYSLPYHGGLGNFVHLGTLPPCASRTAGGDRHRNSREGENSAHHHEQGRTRSDSGRARSEPRTSNGNTGFARGPSFDYCSF